MMDAAGRGLERIRHMQAGWLPVSGAAHVAERQAAGWLVGAAFFVIVVWLAAAACLVQIEYYDGLSAIVNARYFLGTADRYVADRAPMMAVLMLPAELARTAFGLHTLDVRPDHICLAFVHAGYLIAVYRLLIRLFGNSWFVFAAWTAAVPNFIFFSYAPFLSHDIFPGALLLCMLIWCDRFFESPSYVLWGGLVAMGAVAALVKQTFGLFWILVLLGGLFQCGTSVGKVKHATLAKLVCGAFVSGAVTWLALGWILTQADPHAPLLARPLRNLQYLSSVYEGRNVVFPFWIYVRNASAYGWLASLLVVPGWVLSMRGTRLQRSIAVAWIGGLAFLFLLPLREVRYLAFLSPLTACLLIPALRFVAKRKTALCAALVVLAFDLGACMLEAAQIFHPFYTGGIEQRFFDLLDDPEPRKGPVFVNSPMMNFVSPIPSPLAADRYHRVFHFGVIHLRHIYGCQDLRIIADEQHALRSASTCPEGSLLFYASRVVARGANWSAGGPIMGPGFTQCAGVCRSQMVTLADEAGNGPADAETVALLRHVGDENLPPTIQGEPCAESPLGELLPVLRMDSPGNSWWLRRTGPDAYVVLGMPPAPSTAESRTAEIRRFEIRRRASGDASRVDASP